MALRLLIYNLLILFNYATPHYYTTTWVAVIDFFMMLGCVGTRHSSGAPLWMTFVSCPAVEKKDSPESMTSMRDAGTHTHSSKFGFFSHSYWGKLTTGGPSVTCTGATVAVVVSC